MGGVNGMRYQGHFESAEASDFEEPGAGKLPGRAGTPGSVRGRRGNPPSYLDSGRFQQPVGQPVSHRPPVTAALMSEAFRNPI